MNNTIPQDEMNILLGDRNLAVGAHLLNVVGAWTSIKVLNSMLKGGAKRASEISGEINLDMQDVLDTLKDLEAINLIRCRFDDTERVNYWKLKDRGFKITLAGNESGINILYSAESKPMGYLARLRSGIRKSLNR